MFIRRWTNVKYSWECILGCLTKVKRHTISDHNAHRKLVVHKYEAQIAVKISRYQKTDGYLIQAQILK